MTARGYGFLIGSWGMGCNHQLLQPVGQAGQQGQVDGMPGAGAVGGMPAGAELVEEGGRQGRLGRLELHRD